MSLYELIDRPPLDQPLLVMALDGWIDAGGATTRATQVIEGQLERTTVASFDTDALLDHRARRPTMHLVDGVNTGLTWPTIDLQVASDRAGRDLLLLFGAEPDHSWPSFSQAVIELAELFDVRMITGLGAYPAATPHTRPTQLASTATSAELAARTGFVRGTLDVPAGIQAVIEREAAEAGIDAVGLWAQVPHYAAAMPYPAAAMALVEGLVELADLDLDASSLDVDAGESRQRLDALVADSVEHRELVTQLEHHVDTEAAETTDDGPIELRSADELAAEVEQFLRDQD